MKVGMIMKENKMKASKRSQASAFVVGSVMLILFSQTALGETKKIQLSGGLQEKMGSKSPEIKALAQEKESLDVSDITVPEFKEAYQMKAADEKALSETKQALAEQVLSVADTVTEIRIEEKKLKANFELLSDEQMQKELSDSFKKVNQSKLTKALQGLTNQNPKIQAAISSCVSPQCVLLITDAQKEAIRFGNALSQGNSLKKGQEASPSFQVRSVLLKQALSESQDAVIALIDDDKPYVKAFLNNLYPLSHSAEEPSPLGKALSDRLMSSGISTAEAKPYLEFPLKLERTEKAELAKSDQLKKQVLTQLEERAKTVAKTVPGQDSAESCEAESEVPNAKKNLAAVITQLGNSGTSVTASAPFGMTFVKLGPGSFQMGSPPNEVDRKSEEIQHRVHLTRGFEIKNTTITQGQYVQVMGSNPSYFQSREKCPDTFTMIQGVPVCPNHPVESVSWDDTQKFIQKLNMLGDGYQYRLPTEAEWEYAARAGSSTAYSFGNDPNQMNQYGWHDGNSGGQTHAVASLKATASGLYDMHGNVWQWVQDVVDTYPNQDVTDPQGPTPTSGSGRVVRGGSWFLRSKYLRSANRYYYSPDNRNSYVGFRLVRTQ